jgi:hypothetical protein
MHWRRSRVRLEISERSLARLKASYRRSRSIARCLAEDSPAESDSLNPALPALGGLGLEAGGST